VFRNPIDNLQELQQAIEDTKANVAPEILSNSSNNLNKSFFFRTFSPITYFYMADYNRLISFKMPGASTIFVNVKVFIVAWYFRKCAATTLLIRH
jgi:hypothetical protein